MPGIECGVAVGVDDVGEVSDQASGQAGGILALFYALLALTVVMAVLGIATATTLSIHERTRELGMLRALGMTRMQARRMIRWRPPSMTGRNDCGSWMGSVEV